MDTSGWGEMASWWDEKQGDEDIRFPFSVAEKMQGRPDRTHQVEREMAYVLHYERYEPGRAYRRLNQGSD